MQADFEKVARLARDLRREEPRSAFETLGGYAMAARCLDKCRASLLGWEGEFRYGCPMDQEFLNEAGIDPHAFRDYVATGASDREVDRWIREHARVST